MAGTHPTTAGYEALADRIESILQDPTAVTQIKDDRLRRRIAEGGRKLGIAFEEPRDTLRRIGYMVLRPYQPRKVPCRCDHADPVFPAPTTPHGLCWCGVWHICSLGG